MAFVRIQGQKIVIMHSKREGKRVRQEKLHTFKNYAEAAEAIASDFRWNSLCDAIELAKKGNPLNRKALRKRIERALEDKGEWKRDPLKEEIETLTRHLKACSTSETTPANLRNIENCVDELEELVIVIDLLLENIRKQNREKEEMEMEMENRAEGITTAESFFDSGLDEYSKGNWEKARLNFQRGLESDPEHVDLLVHSGLICLIDNDLELALAYFDRAGEIGVKQIERMIKEKPDEYVKMEDFDEWAEENPCRYKDECQEEWNSISCRSCENHPYYSFNSLYRHIEFRPFFRSQTNKAYVLMKMRRYEEVIETIHFVRKYDDLNGLNNMLGESHLCLGELEPADRWYIEMLWPEAFYIKGLIKLLKGDDVSAVSYVLRGIMRNSRMANMILGIEKPENIRYIGTVLDPRLEASEFFHEHEHIFSRHPSFRVILRAIMDDPKIQDLVQQISEAVWRRSNERRYEMDKGLFSLWIGNISEEFLEEHVPRIVERLRDKSGPYWSPEPGQTLEVLIIKKKTQNWLVSLADSPEKTFFIRPKFTGIDINEGEDIKIKAVKSWFYRKNLYVSAERVE